MTDKEKMRILERMRIRMESGSYIALADALAPLKALRDSEIIRLLEPNKTQIVEWFKDRWRDDRYNDYMIEQMFDLLQIDVKWRELLPVLELYKDEIIEDIMGQFKLYGFDRITVDDLINKIEVLQGIGLKWPELANLLVTMEDTHPDVLRESISVAVFSDLLNNDLYRFVSQVQRDAVHDLQDVCGYLDSQKWVFIRSLERNTLSDDLSYTVVDLDKMIAAIQKVLAKCGKHWPELDTFWEDHKHEILERMMSMIKSGEDYNLSFLWLNLSQLESKGITWPELKDVKSHVSDELDNTQLTNVITEAAKVEVKVPNMTPQKVQTALNRMFSSINNSSYDLRHAIDWMRRQKGINVAEILGLNKSLVLYAIEQDILRSELPTAFFTVGYLKSAAGVDWPEIGNLLNQHIDSIKNVINDIIENGDLQYVTSMMTNLSNVNNTEIKKLKGSIRDTLITTLKQEIKSNGFSRLSVGIIETIKACGGKLTLGGSLEDMFMDSFKKSLEQNGLEPEGSIIRARNNLYLKIAAMIGSEQTKAKVKQAVEDHKEDVLDHMVGAIKKRGSLAAYPTISALYELGIDWPEIVATEKALTANMEESA